MSDPAPAKRRGLGGPALLVSAATMLSRLLALGREQLYAALFGASETMYSDAFKVAFRIPNLLRDLFAEGALSAAFVPTFTERLRHEGRDAAFRLANVVMGTILLVVSLITLVGIVVTPSIVELLAPSFSEVPEQFALTVAMTRVMFPFLPLVSLAAVVMGQLNAQERFGVPALASACFNLVAIVAGVALHFAQFDARTSIVAWSGATLLGGFVQLAVQLPSLFRTGFRLRPRIDFKSPGLRKVALLMAPATIGLAATQVNIVVNTSFATSVPGNGPVSWLDYAFRLMQLPIGVFGVAVATIVMTRLAHEAAAERRDEMATTLARGLRLVVFLTLPCTVGLIALAIPITRLLFERGRFLSADTVATATALVMYATGLVWYSAVKVAAPAFYALGKTRVPLAASVTAVCVNLAFNLATFRVLGYWGLALGTSLGALANCTFLLVAFHRAAAPLDVDGLARQFVRVLIAAAACGVAAWFVTSRLEEVLGTEGLLAQVLGVGGGIAAGVLVYVAGARLLRIEEYREFADQVRRRLGRSRATTPPA